MGKIHGITVVLYEKTDTGESDAFGHPIYTEIPVKVENILVGQPTAQEILDTYNLTGKKAVYSLGIPKGDTHIWTDRKIEFFGETWKAIALPVSGIEDLVPLDWNQTIKVERYA